MWSGKQLNNLADSGDAVALIEFTLRSLFGDNA